MKDINLTREEALKLPIMKYLNHDNYSINLSLSKINEIMNLGAKRDCYVASRLLKYKLDGASIFAIFQLGDKAKILVDPKLINPECNKLTLFDLKPNC